MGDEGVNRAPGKTGKGKYRREDNNGIGLEIERKNRENRHTIKDMAE